MKLQRFFCVVLALGVVFVIIAVCLLMPGKSNTEDIISVGIRTNIDGVYDVYGMKFSWNVENKSEHPVHFNEGAVARIMLNGEPYEFESEAIVLGPEETYTADICIPYPIAREEGINSISITATTENGTVATYRKSFDH